ncbi:MAG: macro domain-containing protein [Succinivibrio sp.]|nr:macro domain-containing protein [Succinivibrio sp.]
MDKLATVQSLINMLLEGQPAVGSQATQFAADYDTQRQLLRGLMNMHDAHKELGQEFFRLQDELLSAENAGRELKAPAELEPSQLTPAIRLFEGDLTALKVDAVVNPANKNLLGCFIAGHQCVDNLIHSAAGLQLRFACRDLIQKLGHDLAEGGAVITQSFNLPCRYIIHTVGPKVSYQPTSREEHLLCECYRNALKLCHNNKLTSVAFCPISAGADGFSHVKAAELAVKTVQEDLQNHEDHLTVVFALKEAAARKAYLRALDPTPRKDDDLHPFFNPALF